VSAAARDDEHEERGEAGTFHVTASAQ
jgi:hypothetical protein